MEGFRCSCIGCGKKPEFGVTEIWVESEGGMLCEKCWRAEARRYRKPAEKASAAEAEYCCFCSLCKRRPPDPVYKMWIETEKGCLCEKCWKETIGKVLAERIESTLLERKTDKSEPLDVQLACCLLNKKLLFRAIDGLPKGSRLDVSVDNVEIMKSLVKKIIAQKGCIITTVDDRDKISVLTIKKE